jgi:transposase
VTQQDHIAEERRATQLARFRLVKRLQAAGHSAQAIMRETGLGRCYVSKWIRLDDLPNRNRMEPRVGMPEFYRAYLMRRWAEGCQSVRVLMGEIQTLGYVGCYGGLARLLAPWRLHGVPPDRPRVSDAPVASIFTRHVSPQIAAALLGQRRARLTAHQAETVDALKAHCPGSTTMRQLMLSFRTILRVGKVASLRRWMTRARATGIEPLQRFLRTLQQDQRGGRRRPRTVEQRARGGPHQSPQNVAASDVRPCRRRVPPRQSLADFPHGRLIMTNGGRLRSEATDVDAVDRVSQLTAVPVH